MNSIPFQVSNAEPIDSDQEHEPKRRKVEDGKPGIKRGRWDKYEHSLFVKGLQIYGRQWKLIAEMVRLFFFLLFVVRIAFEIPSNKFDIFHNNPTDQDQNCSTDSFSCTEIFQQTREASASTFDRYGREQRGSSERGVSSAASNREPLPSE